MSYYCGIPGHKALDCQKKKPDQVGQSSRPHTNNFTKDGPSYLFGTIVTTPSTSPFLFLDSGSSQYMTPHMSVLQDYQELPILQIIILGDNCSYQVTGFGSILIKLTTRQNWLILDILYVSDLAKNLLSIAQITKS